MFSLLPKLNHYKHNCFRWFLCQTLQNNYFICFLSKTTTDIGVSFVLMTNVTKHSCFISCLSKTTTTKTCFCLFLCQTLCKHVFLLVPMQNAKKSCFRVFLCKTLQTYLYSKVRIPNVTKITVFDCS